MVNISVDLSLLEDCESVFMRDLNLKGCFIRCKQCEEAREVSTSGPSAAATSRFAACSPGCLTLVSQFKLPWREAGSLTHHAAIVNSGQQVVNKELSLSLNATEPASSPQPLQALCSSLCSFTIRSVFSLLNLSPRVSVTIYLSGLRCPSQIM